MIKGWAERLMLIVGGGLAGLLLVELGLRLTGFTYPTFYVAEELRGYSLLPGAEGWWRTEGEAYIRINSQGLRDREHAKTKPAHTFRIAVLGDSYAEAFQVPLEKTFWSVLAQELSGRNCLPGRTVEVINFGVGGYGTAQQLLTLRHQVWDYEPDLVLVAFFAGNDIKNNSYALQQNPDYPYFVYHDNQPVLDDNFPAPKMFHLRRLFGYGSKYLRVLGVGQLLKNSLQTRQHPAQEADMIGLEVGLDNAALTKPTSEAWQEAWRVTEGLLLAMRNEAEEEGASFLLVTISNGIGVHPDSTVRRRFKERFDVDDFFYPSRRIKALADREKISYLSLGQPFRAYAEKNQVYLHGFENTRLGEGHWNVAGHRLAGELIAGKICLEIRD